MAIAASNMYKWKFIIRIEIFITYLRLGNKVYSNMHYKVIICNFVKCNISNSDEQKYISQMSAFDDYV